MRNLVKSILSFSGAMPLFGMKQLTDLLRAQDRVAENLDAVTQAAQRQLGDPLEKAFQNADRMQRQTVDLIADLLSPGRSLESPALSAGPSTSQAAPSASGPPQAYDADFELLKAIMEAGPVGNPLIPLLMMAAYMNINQPEAGAAFFAAGLEKFGDQLPPPLKSIYLGALGQLRAASTPRVPPPQQPAWLAETLRILEEARALSNNEIFVVRWMIAIVYAQLPPALGLREQAFQELSWCAENSSQAPDPGWLREIYFNLALLYRRANEPAEAASYLRRSGYRSFDKEIVLTTGSSITPQGAVYTPVGLREIPIRRGAIFQLSGFQFSETFFILSEDGRELIAVDAGAQPEFEKAAYEYLKSRHPDLPRLTAVLVTHAHPDHLGGHLFLRQLSPGAKFYIRKTFESDLNLVAEFPIPFSWLLGEGNRPENLAGFTADVEIVRETEIRVGGTRFVLIPVPSGETSPPRQYRDAEDPGDALFVYLPDHGVIFVADFAMPWFGPPFYAAQGSVSAFVAATEKLVEVAARTSDRPLSLLHGHAPLNLVFPTPESLRKTAVHIDWLRREVVRRIFSGMDRVAIQHLNLISPGVLQDPEVQFPYIAMRKNLIDRLYDQRVGYWGSDRSGMDSLSPAELGSVFSHYLGLSEDTLAGAIQRMLGNGDHELAAQTASWALPRYQGSQRLAELQRRAFLKLLEKHQSLDAFRFFVYSQAAGHELLPIAISPVEPQAPGHTR